MGRWNWLVRGSLVVQGATTPSARGCNCLRPPRYTSSLPPPWVIGFSHLKDQVELLVRLLDQVERIKGQLSDTNDTLRDLSKCVDNIRDQSRRVDRLLGHPIDLQDH
jgi:hypothetical protein